jgi:hypothetical protein
MHAIPCILSCTSSALHVRIIEIYEVLLNLDNAIFNLKQGYEDKL